MPMSKDKALEAAKTILNGPRMIEAPRLNRIAAAMRPADPYLPPRVEIPRDAPLLMKALARKSETNYIPLIVDTFGQAMKVDGYFSDQSPELADPWQHWQRNRLDARQTGLHRAVLQYGAAYATVLPGTYGHGQSGPVVEYLSPRKMTAVYQNPASDEWPVMALHVNGSLATLYDEEAIYRFGIENQPRAGMVPSFSTPLGAGGGLLIYIDTQVHDVGVCPVVRYRDRMLLDGEEQYGIVEPLLTIQDRINETTFGMLVAQYFTAFKQRYIIGWVPETEQEALNASASNLWTFADTPADIKVGELTEGDLTKYIDSKQSAIHDLAAIAQLPVQSLGADKVSNISAEALAGLEASKDRKASEIETSLGESHEQKLRLCAHIAGDVMAADDYSSEVRWADATARSFAQTVDGLGKLATMLHVPDELMWEDIPGWTQQKVDRAKQLRQSGNAFADLTNLLNGQANGTTPAAG